MIRGSHSIVKRCARSFMTCALMLLCVTLQSQHARKNVSEYIKKYSDEAIRQMVAYRVPASVTLAQAIFESRHGSSNLARRSNNHFGVKCHMEWHGDTVVYDDDTLNECFRQYASVHESYTDHSRFLVTRTRYAPLFRLSIYDYAGWCHGLKNAGYATYKNYAEELIAIIEEERLFLLDRSVTLENLMAAAKPPPESQEDEGEPVKPWDAMRAALITNDVVPGIDYYRLFRSDRFWAPPRKAQEIRESGIPVQDLTLWDLCQADLLTADEQKPLPVKKEYICLNRNRAHQLPLRVPVMREPAADTAQIGLIASSLLRSMNPALAAKTPTMAARAAEPLLVIATPVSDIATTLLPAPAALTAGQPGADTASGNSLPEPGAQLAKVSGEPAAMVVLMDRERSMQLPVTSAREQIVTSKRAKTEYTLWDLCKAGLVSGTPAISNAGKASNTPVTENTPAKNIPQNPSGDKDNERYSIANVYSRQGSLLKFCRSHGLTSRPGSSDDTSDSTVEHKVNEQAVAGIKTVQEEERQNKNIASAAYKNSKTAVTAASAVALIQPVDTVSQKPVTELVSARKTAHPPHLRNSTLLQFVRSHNISERPERTEIAREGFTDTTKQNNSVAQATTPEKPQEVRVTIPEIRSVVRPPSILRSRNSSLLEFCRAHNITRERTQEKSEEVTGHLVLSSAPLRFPPIPAAPSDEIAPSRISAADFTLWDFCRAGLIAYSEKRSGKPPRSAKKQKIVFAQFF